MNIFFFLGGGGGGVNICVDNVGGHRYFWWVILSSIKSKDSELEYGSDTAQTDYMMQSDQVLIFSPPNTDSL